MTEGSNASPHPVEKVGEIYSEVELFNVRVTANIDGARVGAGVGVDGPFLI